MAPLLRALSTALALGLAACGGGGDGAGTGPGGDPDPGGEVPPGEVVIGDQHNVTFDARGPNSSTQTSGTFARTFTEAGTFTYICTIHGRAVMSGTVEVQ